MADDPKSDAADPLTTILRFLATPTEEPFAPPAGGPKVEVESTSATSPGLFDDPAAAAAPQPTLTESKQAEIPSRPSRRRRTKTKSKETTSEPTSKRDRTFVAIVGLATIVGAVVAVVEFVSPKDETVHYTPIGTDASPNAPLNAAKTQEYFLDGPLLGNEPLDTEYTDLVCTHSRWSERPDALDCWSAGNPPPQSWEVGVEQLLPGYAGPCFPVDQQSVACPIGVTTNEMEYRRYSTLTGIPVPAPDARLSRKSNPWRIRLDDGSICVRRIPSTMPGAPAPAEVGTDMVSDPVTFDCDYGAYADLAIPAYVQIAEDGEPRIDAYGLVHVAEADREKAQELQRSAGGKWTVLHANVGDQSLAEVGVAEAWF